jgi:DNA-binding transcriptional MerR regulator
MRIGEVAERTSLSLRTIRYYEEVGLVVPSARSQGGFRLYIEPDIARLELVKQMKPLGFQLEEMRDMLAVLDPSPTGPGPSDEQRAQSRAYSDTADRRCDELRAKLEMAERFAAMLRKSIKDTPPTKESAP